MILGTRQEGWAIYLNSQIELGVSTLAHLAQMRPMSATRSDLAGALDVSSDVIGLVVWKLRLVFRTTHLVEGQRPQIAQRPLNG